MRDFEVYIEDIVDAILRAEKASRINALACVTVKCVNRITVVGAKYG